ncbi:M20 family metallopeptidase [Alistipes sp. OttesenSCG-928-B03]|nr:M20 family metallopeptidase [Alistipes sp. OttesenSCG-928-B03]
MKTHDILTQAAEISDRIVGFRRQIHRNPELSFAEAATARFVMDTLTAEGIECRPIAKTGVLARIEGSGDLRSAVVLRADIDALPVTEATGLEYVSANQGVMHACGHDMHAAVLMGAMILLNRNRGQIRGTVFGIFQPGEELLPGGASMVLAEDPLRDYEVRAFVGEHVEPELPTGVFGFREGDYMASTDELYFTVRGEGGHAAMPEKLRNPVPAAASLLLELQQITTGADVPSVLSIGRFISDGATNVIPDSVEMQGTLRTFDEDWRAEVKERIREVCASTAKRYNVDIDADIRHGFPSVYNSPEVTRGAAAAVRGLLGDEAVVPLDRRMTGEDFGYYTRRYPSVFYRFGVGGSTTGALGGVLDAATTEASGEILGKTAGNVSDSVSDSVSGEASAGRSCGISGYTPGGQPLFALSGRAGKLHSPVFNPDEAGLSTAAATMAHIALSL